MRGGIVGWGAESHSLFTHLAISFFHREILTLFYGRDKNGGGPMKNSAFEDDFISCKQHRASATSSRGVAVKGVYRSIGN